MPFFSINALDHEKSVLKTIQKTKKPSQTINLIQTFFSELSEKVYRIAQYFSDYAQTGMARLTEFMLALPKKAYDNYMIFYRWSADQLSYISGSISNSFLKKRKQLFDIMQRIHVFFSERAGHFYQGLNHFKNVLKTACNNLCYVAHQSFQKAHATFVMLYKSNLAQQSSTSFQKSEKSFLTSLRNTLKKEEVIDTDTPTLQVLKKLAKTAKAIPNSATSAQHLVYGCDNTMSIKDELSFFSDWWCLSNRGQGDCVFLSLSAGFILWTLSMCPQQLKRYYAEILSKKCPEFANKTVWECMSEQQPEMRDFFAHIEHMRQSLHKSKNTAAALQSFAEPYQSSLRRFVTAILKAKFSIFLQKYQGDESRALLDDTNINTIIQSIQRYNRPDCPRSPEDLNLITILQLDSPANDLWGNLCDLVQEHPERKDQIKQAWLDYCKAFDNYIKRLSKPYTSASATVAVAMLNMYWNSAVRICKKEGPKSIWMSGVFYTNEQDAIEYAYSMELSQIPFALYATPGHLEVMFRHKHLCPCCSCNKPHRPPVNLYWISPELKNVLMSNYFLKNTQDSPKSSSSRVNLGS